MNITKKVTRTVSVVGIGLSIAATIYSILKLVPKFDKIDGVNSEKFVRDINKKIEEKESEYVDE